MEPEILPFLQLISGTISNTSVCEYITLNARAFFRARYVQLLPWITCALNIPSTEYILVVNLLVPLVGNRVQLKFGCQIGTIWNTIPQCDIRNLYDFIPQRVRDIIAVRGSCTNSNVFILLRNLEGYMIYTGVYQIMEKT